MIRMSDVSFGYGSGSVLRGLSLSIAPGEVMMLTGPNGVGKSTLLRLLAGVARPMEGIMDHGFPPGVDPRSRIGYLPDSLSIYRSMTPLRAAAFHAGIFGSTPADLTLAKRAGADLRLPIAEPSLGQRVLVHLEIVLSTTPELILIDEVFHAVDPHIRNLVMERLISEMEERHPTVVMVNLNFAEVEFLVDRVVFLSREGILLDESATGLKHSVRKLISDSVPEGLPVLVSRSAAGGREHVIYPFPGGTVSTEFQEMDLTEILTAFMELEYSPREGGHDAHA
jgi:ABC-type multidrug transport system ATPase subunit